jgi:putative glycosyltransferase (TIGR04372 family)
MGRLVNERFDLNDSNIIDYANSASKSDFADIFLLARCSFCVSTSTGVDGVAALFRVPIGLTNIVNLSSVSTGELVKLYMPKKLLDLKTNNFLTLNDLYKRNLHKVSQSQVFESSNIQLIENSSDELLNFIKELTSLLNQDNTRKTSESPEFNDSISKQDQNRLNKLSRTWIESNGYYLS